MRVTLSNICQSSRCATIVANLPVKHIIAPNRHVNTTQRKTEHSPKMATILQNAQTQQSTHNAHNNIEREIVFYTNSFPYECTFQQLLLLRPLIASSTNRHEKYLTTDVLYVGSGRNVISFNIQAARKAPN